MFTRYQILQPKRVCLYSFLFFFLVPEVTESKAETSPVIDDTFDFTDAHLEVAFSYFHQLWWFWLRTSEEEQVFVGMHTFLFLAWVWWLSKLLPSTRWGYNLGFGICGGFAPLLAEASLDWSRYGPGVLLSVAGFLTVLTILASVHCLEHGKVEKLAHIRAKPYMANWMDGEL